MPAIGYGSCLVASIVRRGVNRLVLLPAAFVVGLGPAACEEDPGRARGRTPPPLSIPPVDFTTQVLPLLEARCLPCHSADEATREGDLRLDTRLGATLRRLGGRRAIQPGSPDASLVIATIESTDPALRMPPDAPLDRDDVELLRLWIAQGAPYAEHWAYAPPVRPDVPAGPTSPVDAFIDAMLVRTGFEASPRATPEAQLRRLSLALTGLPPTPEELDAFLAAPDDVAYEATVERLLESDRHAEHLARDWLDHVGYGDSSGMYMDVEREMWAYREWVIDSFRSNRPLDAFLTLQLAGDLGLGATDDDRLATAFLRLHRATEEGGIHLDEFQALYASERAVMTANAMLGMTMQCARCHEHRYDPLTQRDFYRLTACFHRVNDSAITAPIVPPRLDEIRPSLTALGPLQRAELAEVRSERAAIDAALDALEVDAALAAWDAALGAGPTYAPAVVRSATGAEGSTLTPSGARVVASGTTPHVESWDVVLDAPAGLRAVRIRDILPRGALPPVLSEVRLRVEGPTSRRTLAIETRGAPTLDDGATSTDLEAPTQVIVVLLEPLALGPGERLHVLVDMRRGNGRLAGEMAFDVSDDAIATLDDALLTAHARPPASRTTAQRTALRSHYLLFHASDPTTHRQAVASFELSRREVVLSQPSTTRIMRDDAPDITTHILARGDFYRPLEVVGCGVPEALTSGDPLRADRGALAEWIVGPDNPLTARVIANRLFQLVFGRGIVATPQDFGSRGAIPSHPELIDWLATELVASGWDARHLLRVLVTSEAFRRSSAARPELADVDPDGELWARGPRRRLDAEVLRDQALYVAGLLVERVGGPSVRPYQPGGLYEQLVDEDNPMRTYRPDRAPERIHRRGVYTFWRRGTLLPSLLLLDAPDRTVPAARRDVTITPTQALALANEPLFVEAARALAERERREHPGDVDAQLRSLFRRATARVPTAEELAILRTTYDDELALARTEPATAAVLAIGESDWDADGDVAALVALTTVARTVLTLDETITRE